MSNQREAEREISLVLDVERMPAKRFVAAARDFLKLVETVSKEVNPERVAPKLAFRVEAGSQVLHLSGAAGVESAIVGQGFDAVVAGLTRLSTPTTSSPPPGFDDQALKALRSLAKTAHSAGTEARIHVGVDTYVPLTRQLVETVESVRAGGYMMWGSYEGRLEMVNVHDPDHLRCYIYRLRDNERVLATFVEEQFSMVRDNLDRRVIATGKIFYDDNNRIKHLEVRNITPMRDDHDLPSIQQMAGILGAG